MFSMILYKSQIFCNRTFPLMDLNANRSSYVEPIINFLGMKKRDVMEVKVAYEFQKGGNTMPKICWKSQILLILFVFNKIQVSEIVITISH